MATLSPVESEARDLIEASRKADNGDSGYPERQSIRRVFEAFYIRSFKVAEILKLAEVIDGVSYSEDSVKGELTAFVRAGLLRSRIVNGIRRYEIALTL